MLTKQEYNSKAHSFLKAEAFCAELMAGGVLFEEINLLLQSNFKKSFRNEIEDVSVEKDEVNGALKVAMKVNRDGIYDRLPEGLFHQTKGSSRTATTQQMTEEYRQYKEEEKLARKYFQPIEQELFRYSSQVEQQEQQWLFNILNGRLNKDLYDFWKLDPALPQESLHRLVNIMPWASLIKGDIILTALALQMLLDKPVSYEEFIVNTHQVGDAAINIDNMILGSDAVMGKIFSEPAAGWRFFISGVKNDDLHLYRTGNQYAKLFEQFEEIFIPLPIDVIFELTEINLDASKTGDRLGVSFIL
ncbi:MAG: hypothetical protein ABIW38_02755 [Ferruginibacter sp.]